MDPGVRDATAAARFCATRVPSRNKTGIADTPQAADPHETTRPVTLAHQRLEAGNRADARRFYEKAADAGSTHAVAFLAHQREEAGDHEAAERLAHRAVDAGNFLALRYLAELREESPAAYELNGLDADGALAERWEWPEPRFL